MKENHILMYISERFHLVEVTAVFAGLAKIIEYVNDFKFTDSDIEYLRTLNYDEDYLDYLKNLKFTGSIRSVREGEIVFGNEPLIRVEAPLIQAQLMETAILNIVNYQILIATKLRVLNTYVQ